MKTPDGRPLLSEADKESLLAEMRKEMRKKKLGNNPIVILVTLLICGLFLFLLFAFVFPTIERQAAIDAENNDVFEQLRQGKAAIQRAMQITIPNPAHRPTAPTQTPTQNK